MDLNMVYIKSYMTRYFSFILVLTTSLICGSAARAIESEWAVSSEARSRLISGVSASGLSSAAPMGFEIRLKEGWKTYWKAPGPQGYPPNFDWAGSDNVRKLDVTWPTPTRFNVLGYDSIGYTGDVLLPLSVSIDDPSKPAQLDLKVEFLTCKEICIPQFAQFNIFLPAGSPQPTVYSFAIDQARGLSPAPAGAGFGVERVSLSTKTNPAELILEGKAPFTVQEGDLFIDGLSGYFFSAPKIDVLSGDRFRLTSVSTSIPPAFPSLGQEATYTLVLNGQSFSQKASLSQLSADPIGPRELLLIVALALVGGFVLNFMPCVLPVLAIKLTSVLSHFDDSRRAIRMGFLATSAGILVSFLGLALGAIALKHLGMTVGWGMQFQEPFFVAVMVFVMALFACNLWGFFEFSLPQGIARISDNRPTSGLGGAFWTGVLVTLLATPCSAPFVGTALTFALSRGAFEIIVVFVAMALGLCLPYLLTALFPSAVKMLPRPGRWMQAVRIGMGFLVALTGAWLLWVLFNQTGLVASVVVGIASVLIVGFFSCFRAQVRWLATLCTIIAAFIALEITQVAPERASFDSVKWIKFDELDISRRIDSGEIILVDVTAEWCVTCKWNKAAVLYNDPILNLLTDDVTPIQADWTRPNNVISDFLARNNRFGIPFNIVYGPGAKEGIVLPELLSAGAVMQAIIQARGS